MNAFEISLLQNKDLPKEKAQLLIKYSEDTNVWIREYHYASYSGNQVLYTRVQFGMES
jgi:hypothetical protein